jgi:hypothetical protein
MRRPVLSIAALSFLTVSNIALIPAAIAQNTALYPAEAVKIFTDTCVEQGDGKIISTQAMREICTCNIREIQQTYTFEEFTRIGAGLGQGKPAPAQVNSIVENCVMEVLNK